MRTLVFSEALTLVVLLVSLLLLNMLMIKSLALTVVLAVLLVVLFYLFRFPERTPKEKEGMVAISDGKILSIEDLPLGKKKISTFLRLSDPHIIYSPVNGVVKQIIYTPGSFYSAWSPRSKGNEMLEIIIETDEGDMVEVVEIAGMIMRRTVTWLTEGEKVSRGQPIGMIKFSSRTELILPNNYPILVKKGDEIRGGEQIVAKK